VRLNASDDLNQRNEQVHAEGHEQPGTACISDIHLMSVRARGGMPVSSVVTFVFGKAGIQHSIRLLDFPSLFA
jgi:hypothetical protein